MSTCTTIEHSGIKACGHCKPDAELDNITTPRRRRKRNRNCQYCNGQVAVCKVCDLPLPV